VALKRVFVSLFLYPCLVTWLESTGINRWRRVKDWRLPYALFEERQRAQENPKPHEIHTPTISSCLRCSVLTDSRGDARSHMSSIRIKRRTFKKLKNVWCSGWFMILFICYEYLSRAVLKINIWVVKARGFRLK
jgi:hypothetical protein